MAEHRKAPLDRVLTLVRALADSVEGLTLDEMAEVLGQKRRSAERARDTIALHFDLDEIEDGRRKRFLIRDSLRRHYVRPNAAELAALQAEVLAASKAKSPRAELLDAQRIERGPVHRGWCQPNAGSRNRWFRSQARYGGRPSRPWPV